MDGIEEISKGDLSLQMTLCYKINGFDMPIHKSTFRNFQRAANYVNKLHNRKDGIPIYINNHGRTVAGTRRKKTKSENIIASENFEDDGMDDVPFDVNNNVKSEKHAVDADSEEISKGDLSLQMTLCYKINGFDMPIHKSTFRNFKRATNYVNKLHNRKDGIPIYINNHGFIRTVAGTRRKKIKSENIISSENVEDDGMDDVPFDANNNVKSEKHAVDADSEVDAEREYVFEYELEGKSASEFEYYFNNEVAMQQLNSGSDDDADRIIYVGNVSEEIAHIINNIKKEDCDDDDDISDKNDGE